MRRTGIESRLERLEQAITPPQSIFVVRVDGEEREVSADSFFANPDRMEFVRMGSCTRLDDLDKLLDYGWKNAYEQKYFVPAG